MISSPNPIRPSSSRRCHRAAGPGVEPPPTMSLLLEALKKAERAKEEAQRRPRGSRASAKRVFEAKFREPNPRLPFYVTLGVLGVFALGTLLYFWMQLRPPAALVSLNPARQAEASAPVPQISPPAPAAAPMAAPNA